VKKLIIAYAVTVPISAWFALRGQLAFLRLKGHSVSLTASPGDNLALISQHECIKSYSILTEREISPMRDLIALWRYWRHWSRLHPDITNVGTPKAGLVAGIAAWLARVPLRIYTLHGLRLETTSGWKRILLMLTERVACACAHYVICVSPSLRQEALRLNLCDPEKLIVLGRGSANGVDIELYSKKPGEAELQHLRQKLGLPSDARVIGFVGRLTRDKGINELLIAFQNIINEFTDLKLLLIGDFENGDPVDTQVQAAIKNDENIIVTGFVRQVASYYHLMNVLVLPTYREGLPGAPLEAAAAGLPVITTNATGAQDAVLHEVTGLIVGISDTSALTAGLRRILSDSALAKDFGNAGRNWVEAEFSSERVWANLESLYLDAFRKRSLKINRDNLL
jgi:glycosyltransferase involved in cell wall biosynthesis